MNGFNPCRLGRSKQHSQKNGNPDVFIKIALGFLQALKMCFELIPIALNICDFEKGGSSLRGLPFRPWQSKKPDCFASLAMTTISAVNKHNW